MVIPCQLSSQLVAIKSQSPVHTLGFEAALADQASMGKMSAAHTSPPPAAPPAARIIAPTIPSLGISAPCAARSHLQLAFFSSQFQPDQGIHHMPCCDS